MKLKQLPVLIFPLILTLALVLRLYKINNPIADWHSWRQADTAAVTRYYVQHGINLLIPKYHDLSSIPSGQPNPQGYRLVEFPLYNALTAFLYSPFSSQVSLEAFHRLVSIAFSLGSLTFLYLLVKLLSGQTLALLAGFFFAVLPYNIFYSRAILPEVPLVFFSLAAIYFQVKRLLKPKHSLDAQFWLSAISAALAILLKPYALVLLLPLAYFTWKQCGLKFLKDKSSYLYFLITVTPFLLWRFWIQQFPEGIPAYLWLLNANNIRFKGAFFRWLFADRLGRLILGFWGLILFGFGLINKPKPKAGWFYFFWLLAIGAYLTIFAAGNVQHDYYQIITIPIICIFLAQGAGFLLSQIKSNLLAPLVLLLSLVFMLAFSWYEVRGFFNINHPEIVIAGQTADQLLPQEAKVIAPYQADTAFLYQTNRSGWPIGGQIPDKVKQGATHYVSVNFDDEANTLASQCPVLEKTDQYIIIDLQSCEL